MRRGACAAAFVSLLACACSPTEILVVCDSDLEPGVEISAIAMSATGPASFTALHRFDLADTTLPFSVGIAPAHRDDEEIRIVVEALSPDGSPVLHFVAVTDFVPHQTRVLEIPLARACASDTSCDDTGDLTCSRGECVPQRVDAASLSEYDGAPIAPLFDGPRVAPDAGVDSGPECVEGLACETRNPCEIGAIHCAGGTSSCEAIDRLLPGASCGLDGRMCNTEGQCTR